MSIVFRDIEGGLVCPQGSVACIGAFDGLHRGHRALVAHTVARARDRGLPAVALTFEPLPREWFAGDAKPPRLLLPRDKVEGLRALGIDHIGLLRFNARMAATPAEGFVTGLLQGRLQAREVWIGPDFRFGHARGGDLALLQRMGAAAGFSAHAIAPVLVDGRRVSSSDIRTQLQQGDFAAAQRLLGHPYRISGRVVRGRQLGRTLGFPTANQRFGRYTPPLQGIFATCVHGVGDAPWPAVSSFGTRPTVGGVEPLLETHLFDFDGDLYGRRIGVELVARLRDELHFADLDALIVQMHRDAAQARAILASPPSPLSQRVSA